MSPIQQNWINFKTHFLTAHRELEETGELTMEDAGYHQANLVNDIVSHISGLPFPYFPQDPTYIPILNSSPTIVPTAQPTPVANVATYVVSNILFQILTSMQHIQKLLIHIQTNQTGGEGKTSNINTHIYPTCQVATEPRHGQPHKPLP